MIGGVEEDIAVYLLPRFAVVEVKSERIVLFEPVSHVGDYIVAHDAAVTSEVAPRVDRAEVGRLRHDAVDVVVFNGDIVARPERFAVNDGAVGRIAHLVVSDPDAAAPYAHGELGETVQKRHRADLSRPQTRNHQGEIQDRYR